MTRRQAESGQALVEFSLTIIVFMVLVLAVVDVGRAVWNYNTLASATREGTRFAIVHGSNASTPSGPSSNDAKVNAAVAKYASGLNSANLTTTSTWLDGSNAAGSRVKVTTTYKFSSIFSSLLGISPFTMTSSSTMTITN
jgi:Flp pilus assembly protein TadG